MGMGDPIAAVPLAVRGLLHVSVVRSGLMLKTLLGVIVELVVATALSGLMLAVAVPFFTRTDLMGADDVSTRVVITAVLVGAVAVALFRPSSAIRRHGKR